MPYRKTFLHTSTHKNASTYRHTYSAKLKGTINMTEGPLFGKILVFALPLILTNLLQTFYNAADMMIASMSSEPDAVGAIGMTGAFINLVLNVFVGFATGANVMVARYLGANEKEKTSRTTHTAIVMSLIFGVASSLIGQIISRPVLLLLGAQGRLLDLATTYTRIYFLGVPFTSLANYLISIFRAKGDTRTPLFVLSATGVLNVGLNLFFVLVCGMSVEGVAIATSIANLASAAILLIRLSKDEGACRFSLKKICCDREAFRDILKIGLPAGIQGSLFSLSNMIIQSSILRMNEILCPPNSSFDPVVNGNAAATNLEGFLYTTQNSVYQAAITFTSQNAGAKKYKRIYRIMICSYIIGACVIVPFSQLTFLLRDPLLALYGVKAAAAGTLEQIAYTTAIKRMEYVFIPYIVCMFMDAGCGIVRGLGKSMSSTIISLLGACVFRVAWILLVFNNFPSLEIIYLSYPISWTITGVTFLVYSLVTIRKLIKKQKLEE